ncbi:LysM domain-containing protein [Mycolicibacterium moriokaense]|nr:LysM domain-containing protein [Mycolicibacterium moriokaense]
MLSASDRFLERTDALIRPISWGLFISYARELDDSAEFFTVGVSEVGGPDVIKGTDDVIQQWDKYRYYEYSDRVVSMEWSQSMDPLYSVQSAMGDLVLDNADGYLSGDNYFLPWRPVRLTMGFGNTMTSGQEQVPQFVGVTEKAPTVDGTNRTITYHIIDFMSTLYDRVLTGDVILTNVRTDEALDILFQAVGLSPTQYDLDLGFNFIPFLYFPAQTKFGDIARKLMEAEMGRIFMTETGRIQFHNRQHFTDFGVWVFDKHNVIEYTTLGEDDIINTVDIVSNVREVQAIQPYWQSSTVYQIPAGETVELPFANFEDPVTSVDDPVPYALSSTSYYIANTKADSTGDDVTSGLTLTATTFSTSYLMSFENTTSEPIYITSINLFATPAIVVRTVKIRQQDDDSVDSYDPHILTIDDNDFFIDEETAISKAKIILADNASFGQLQTVTVMAVPTLQIGDAAYFAIREHTYISVTGDTLPDIATAYSIDLSDLEALNPTLPSSGGLDFGTKVNVGIIPELCTILGISNSLNKPLFTQVLTVRPLLRTDYFTAGESYVGGTDVIAP